jgi:hypothetical protein
MKKIIFIVAGVIIMSSCCNFYAKIENKKGYKRLVDNYDMKESYKLCVLQKYDSSLIYFLPDLDSGDCYNFAICCNDTSRLHFVHLVMFFSDKQTDSIIDYANKNAIRKYHFTDSCLMIVNYDKTKSHENKIKQCNTFADDMLPVTNFNFLDRSVIINEKFYKNATIYLLGAERGKFLPEYELTNEGVGLPAGWEHGYTKGMAIWCNIVVYWLEVW